MSTYLLLRDNKENGPLTFEEIKAKGLKAYDLVWVEGKSAAWRYPGEIEELKPFSPEVVEQPFDRFFKRPSQANATSRENVPASQHQTRVTESETGVITYQQASTQTGKKNVYVTMPSVSKTAAQVTPNASAEPKAKDPLPAKPLLMAETTFPIESPTPAKEIKQSSLNYTTQNETYKPTAINRPAKQANFKKPLMIAGTMVLLLGGGIVIGVMIAKPRSGSPAGTLQGKDLANLPASTNQQTAAIPVSAVSSGQTRDSQPTGSTLNQDLPVTEPNPSNIHAGEVTSQQKPLTFRGKVRKNLLISSDQPVKADSGASNTTSAVMVPVQHREATHRTDVSASDKPETAAPLINMVSTGANKYTVGAFGGISDLQLTVTNRSPHALDLVVLEVQYIQANKKVFKTENLYFKNINAGAALMQEAPKSPRGIKVQYRITLINSKEPGLSYSGL